ncbi:MAG: hypothetical protein AAGC57_07725 [Pseudomonadota bacterium]
MFDLLDLIPSVSAFDAVGLIGVLLYVGAYSGVQVGQIDGNGLVFTAMNGVAAFCMLISLIGAFNLASAIMNTLFFSFSLIGFARQLAAQVSRGRARIGLRL